MNVLITGGAGFIGSHLAEALARRPGDRVRVLDNLTTGTTDNFGVFRNGIEFLQGDVCDAAARAAALDGVDVVFHLAALNSIPRSLEFPEDTYRNGTQATFLLLDDARKCGVKRFIFASSSSVYGNQPAALKVETMLPQPLAPYAAMKLGCEAYVAAYARSFALDAAILRFFNVFGPRQNPSSQYSGAIAKFCRAFCRGEEIAIFGDGEQSRDFTYVENVVNACLSAAHAPQPLQGDAFNIACGARHSLNDTVRILNELTGKNIKPRYLPARKGDVEHSQADISKARSILGYQPAVQYKEGLARTLEWYRQSKI